MVVVGAVVWRAPVGILPVVVAPLVGACTRLFLFTGAVFARTSRLRPVV